MMLGQEMIGVFDADVVIAFDVGSGELFKAVLMQKIFGIGICKTEAHKKSSWIH